ncbi:MAG: ABC transporter ATP-binding protein [bacterium]
MKMPHKEFFHANNLSVRINDACIVNDVSFSLEKGKVLAIVGESGSGKTTLCRALTKLFTQSTKAEISGTVNFRDTELMACTESELGTIRSTSIRYIFPEPQQALNPIARIRTQMNLAAPAIKMHQLREALLAVEIDNPDEVLNYYPHQLSIGMSQRVMIAMALLPNPSLLIADEPTSAVDASLKYKLLNLLRSLQRERQMTMIVITHDLEVAKKYADEVAVLLDGQLVEIADCSTFFRGPRHPYSQSLIEALPSLTPATSARIQ